jgi:hypothetical protein
MRVKPELLIDPEAAFEIGAVDLIETAVGLGVDSRHEEVGDPKSPSRST